MRFPKSKPKHDKNGTRVAAQRTLYNSITKLECVLRSIAHKMRDDKDWKKIARSDEFWLRINEAEGIVDTVSTSTTLAQDDT